jgi:hypothetical protein
MERAPGRSVDPSSHAIVTHSADPRPDDRVRFDFAFYQETT